MAEDLKIRYADKDLDEFRVLIEEKIEKAKFIRDLKSALMRIENKTYGICRVTGKLINKERLKLVPHATLSIEAKNMQK
jgi:RNA polymerase-binding transcription factor DksA